MATSKTFTWLVDPAGASNYSHSTIYTTDTSSRGTQDIAPLTSYWTAPSQCVDRWISAFPFVAQAKTNSAQGSVTAGSSNPLQYTFVGFSTNPTNTILPRFPATDPLYISCLPYGSPNHYSPGICPDGQTVAEVTEFHLTMTSNIVETHFQGSCCREGMTFGSELQNACISSISTPFRIHVPLTTYLDSQNKSLSRAFELYSINFVSSGYGRDGYTTSTISNISTATSGFIAADPIVIGWREQDLRSFPTNYVSSLAQRYKTDWSTLGGSSPAPSPAGTATIPKETNHPTESLTKGARTGIGVGVGFGAALMIAVLIFVLVKKRKGARMTEGDRRSVVVPDVEDGKIEEKFVEDKPQELECQGVQEMPGEYHSHELDSRNVTIVPGSPVELDSSSNIRQRPEE